MEKNKNELTRENGWYPTEEFYERLDKRFIEIGGPELLKQLGILYKDEENKSDNETKQ